MFLHFCVPSQRKISLSRVAVNIDVTLKLSIKVLQCILYVNHNQIYGRKMEVYIIITVNVWVWNINVIRGDHYEEAVNFVTRWMLFPTVLLRVPDSDLMRSWPAPGRKANRVCGQWARVVKLLLYRQWYTKNEMLSEWDILWKEN